MRLDFNILWIEDQPGAVKAQSESIERKMRSEGFRLQTTFVSSVEEAEENLKDDIFKDHVDLILMDFELAGTKDGGEGLEMVRGKCPFKDIVFYSAKVPQELKTRVSDKQISGVFCTSRIGLPDTVFGVFTVLVKKVLDIDHSRGIAMGATSEIDDFITQALEVYLAKSDSAVQTKALAIAGKQVEKIKQGFEKECGELEALTDATELKSFHGVYTSVKRLILLRKLLKLSGRKDIDLQAMLDYEEKTLPKRNNLAHVTVERDGFSRRIFHKGVELTVDDMRELRVDLLKHHEMFEALVETLKSS